MYFHWAAFFGWAWCGVVIALMAYWTRHDDRDWREEDEDARAGQAPSGTARPAASSLME